MFIHIILIILGIFIVIWLYALVLIPDDEVPSVSTNNKATHRYQKQINYFLSPFHIIYKGIISVLKFLWHVIVDIIAEMIIWGIIRLIFLAIRILFTALFRIFD